MKVIALDTGKKNEYSWTKAFWNRNFGIELNKDIWTIANQVTKEVRLRELHWKIIHNIYPTNITLKKMNIRPSDKCCICPNETDYIEHFFFFCDTISKFWKEIEILIFNKTQKSTRLGVKEILFGYHGKENKNIVNKVILLGKMCISIYRKTNMVTPLKIVFENHSMTRKIWD